MKIFNKSKTDFLSSDYLEPDSSESVDDGTDYTILVNGSVFDSSIYNGCDENFEVTGDVVNSNFIATNRRYLNRRGAILNGNVMDSEILTPCDHDLEIHGDITSSVIVHGQVQTYKGRRH